MAQKINERKVIDTFAATGAGDPFFIRSLPVNFGAYSGGTHSGDSTVKIQYSADNGTTWNDTGSQLTLSGANDADMFASQSSPYLMRYYCTHSGTGNVYTYTEE